MLSLENLTIAAIINNVTDSCVSTITLLKEWRSFDG